MKAVKASCTPGRAFSLILLLSLSLLAMQAQAQYTPTQLYSFTCNGNDCPNGSIPSPLIQSADGNFYGTTNLGGTGNKAAGTVFKLTPSGQLTTLYTFVADQSGNYPNSANPGGLVEGNDGFLYGSTLAGGPANTGVAFKVSKSGQFQVIYNSNAGGVLGSDGNFYGCGAGNLNTGQGGTLYRLTPGGTFTVLHTFNIPAEGIQCMGMIAGSDGNLYGTMEGGSVKITTLFRLTPKGKYTILQTVHYGQFTTTLPVESANGKLYGGLDFVENGGPFVPGFFQDDLSGKGYSQIVLSYQKLQYLYEMLEASDGNFWGESPRLGNNGAIVSFAHDGSPLQQIDFPGYSLTQAADGRILGLKGNEIFALTPAMPAPPPLFVRSRQSSGKVGSHVMIQGAHFVGTTTVTFNGVNATFQVLNAGNILATVPAGATTGPIAVTNAGGTTDGKKNFTVE
jgi:uncharacterized repeat protein (TIGR03803 family)